MTPAVAYLRMSSDKQDTSIPAQRDAIARLAKSGRFKLLREYVDAGISGDDTTRRVEFLNDGDCDFVVGHFRNSVDTESGVHAAKPLHCLSLLLRAS